MARKNNVAVIYARFSYSGQREESIEGQVRECTAYAEKLGLTVAAVYADRAKSGTTDARPEFQRLIRDAERGIFQAVICYKHDRFARNRYDAAVYKARLRASGVDLLYSAEPITEGAQGILLDSVLEGMAEYYSRNLAENVKRGMYESALKLQTCGVVCFGYKKGPDGRFAIDEKTGPVVQRIFREYIEGRPAKMICAELNAEGVRTVKGRPFGKDSIRNIIRCEKYKGVYNFCGVRDEHGIPPLVSPDDWARAQSVATLHAEKPALKREDGGYVLSGKLFCGECGGPMISSSGVSASGKLYRYYKCREASSGGPCKKRRIAKEWIEETVLGVLISVSHSPDLISGWADEFLRWQAEQPGEAEHKAALARVSDCEAAVTRWLDTLGRVGPVGDIVDRYQEAREQLDEARAALARIEADLGPVLSRADIEAFLSSFADGDATDERWRLYLVDTFLRAAWVFDDGRIIVQLNYSGPGGKIEKRPPGAAEGEPSESGPPFPPDVVDRISFRVRVPPDGVGQQPRSLTFAVVFALGAVFAVPEA